MDELNKDRWICIRLRRGDIKFILGLVKERIVDENVGEIEFCVGSVIKDWLEWELMFDRIFEERESIERGWKFLMKVLNDDCFGICYNNGNGVCSGNICSDIEISKFVEIRNFCRYYKNWKNSGLSK
jgi:hypothetical protein